MKRWFIGALGVALWAAAQAVPIVSEDGLPGTPPPHANAPPTPFPGKGIGKHFGPIQPVRPTQVSAVREPGSLILLGAGLLALAGVRRRRW